MIAKTNCQNHGFIIGHPLYSVYQSPETLVSIAHHACAFIDKILKNIVQIFEWLGKFVTKFYTNSPLGDFLKQKGVQNQYKKDYNS